MSEAPIEERPTWSGGQSADFDVALHLVRPEPVPVGSDLRAARLAARISLQTVAGAIGSWPTRISQLERGLKHDTALARRYMAWHVAHGEDAPKAKRFLAA